MKTPRDISGSELAKSLHKIGYRIVRQTGSHIRLSSQSTPAHHITIPSHNSLRVGTISAILSSIAEKMEISKEELLKLLGL